MANLSNINNKFLVTTGGNVLIGQTSAVGSSIFQVTGNSTFAGTITSGTLSVGTSGTSRFTATNAFPLQLNRGLAVDVVGAAGTILGLGAYSTGTTYIDAVRITGVLEGNGTDGDMSLQVLNSGTHTTALTLNNDTNATFAGNVGIGAAASDGNLHVRKTGVNTGITNVLMNANFADGSNGTGLSIGYRTDETTAVIAARTATGNIAFYSYDAGWSESMRIKNNGNVGINTDSPDYLLDIEGASPRIRVKETSSNTSTAMVEVENSDGRGAMLGIGGSGRTDILANRGYINAQSETDGLAIGTEGTDPILFYTQGIATSNERMRITSAGNIQFAQDGYINTNTADASDNLSLQLSGGGAFGDTRGACIALAGNENGNGGLIQLRAGQGQYSEVRTYTSGAERTRVEDNGDFILYGGRLYLNSGTGYNNTGYIYLSNGRTAIESNIVNATANGDTSLNFKTRKGGTTASALFIDQFRNSVFSFSVGIGMTPAADAKLEIADGSFRIRGNQTHSIQLANSSGNTRSALGQAGNEGDLSLYRSNNVKHVYLSSYYNSYINPSNGNLGIGTTSPNNGKLEVQQTAITPALWVQTGGTTDTYYIADFRTGTNASALAIKGNGRVGVGESTPAEKLEVNGNIKAADTTGKFFTNAYSFSGVVLVDFFQHTNDGIWEYTLKVNPNTAGSGSYIDYYYGKIGVGIGWSGSNVTQYLWHQPTNTAPRTLYNSGGGNLGLSFQMLHSGSVYTTLPLNTGPWYLRLTGLGTSVSGEIFFRRLA